MPNVKKINHDWSETGITAYLIFERGADGFRMNPSQVFEANPSSYPVMTESSAVGGRYAYTITAALNDGKYNATIKKQSGGSQAPLTDVSIGTGEMVIKDDSEVYLDALPSFVQKWILNKLVVGDTQITLYDDDNVTVLKTWMWDGATKVRSKAT